AYYGIQTQRAVLNFNLTGVPISHHPELIRALAFVKQACARANRDLGLLEPIKAQAIEQACEDILAGELHDQFVVDLIQGGAGTSTNMNANEVIANRGLEHLGHTRGEYQYLHPNNDVNMSQSTNDVYPTAARLAIILADDPLIVATSRLQLALEAKASEFSSVLKMGRTQLQDAVPMTLGQEFAGWATTLSEDIQRMEELARLFGEINLGGTAIGTGINTHPRYTRCAVEHLAGLTGIAFSPAANLVEATSDMGAFVIFSSMLKRLAVKLSKIANDLRLLSSGPRAGFGELRLPAMQPGSSIMPGKVNPVIPEAVNQAAFQVIGNDLAVTFAAEAGQLQLNAFEPLIIYNVLGSLRLMTHAINMLTDRCIVGIQADAAHTERLVHSSIGIITAFSPHIGYENATRVAGEALLSGTGIVDLIKAEGLLDDARIDAIIATANLTGPSAILGGVSVDELDRTHTHLPEE
ncbi:MAG: aspartate ammonia-lyase, partial [Gammaproteobacteria bacterium]|nr:aspartate ammonia-lyase [Gammaproteobacteria bacterium]